MAKSIQSMFDGIARRYDFLNHFLSAGRDRAWRKKASRFLPGQAPLRVLDLCGGTGDFWKTWAETQSATRAHGVIADFSMPMLLEARKKLLLSGTGGGLPKPGIVRMDALRPCFKPGTFDAVLCAYGMRNLDSIETGAEQIRALLKPGGIFITLEFFRPTTWFTRLFYQGLAPLCIPLLGWLFSSRRQAYAYLVNSIRGFRTVGEYRECFLDRGFKDVAIVPCDFGISHIVTAIKS